MTAHCRACGGDKAKHKLERVPVQGGIQRVRVCPVYQVEYDPEDPDRRKDGAPVYRRMLGTG